MTPEAINLYLEDNGVKVTGNTDQYYRLSGETVKAWTNSSPQPSLADRDWETN